MKIEIPCSLSRHFRRGSRVVRLGRYSLRLVPRLRKRTRATLEFDDDYFAVSGHSNPQEEGKIILGILSMMLDTRIDPTGPRINNIDIGHRSQRLRSSADLQGEIEIYDLTAEFEHLLQMSDQLIKQFVRACHAYALAIQSLQTDISLAFLLLVTTVECLSTQDEFIPNDVLNKTNRSAGRYVRFTNTFCLDKSSLMQDGNESLFERDLKTIYYVHRSGFVHGGREVSIAARAADQHGLQSLLHIEEGKDVRTPGPMWFCKVVRNSLRGFLASGPRTTRVANPHAISEIAASRAILQMYIANPSSPQRDAPRS